MSRTRDLIPGLSPEDETMLQAECRLRMIRYLDAGARGPEAGATSIDLFVEGFWGAIDAMRNPRDRALVEAELEMLLARRAGLVK